MRHSFVKKLWFLEVLGWKRVLIDDLGGLNLLPIFDFENIATKEVSHFSGLSLSFLFVKWTKTDKTLLIPFSTKKWPHIWFCECTKTNFTSCRFQNKFCWIFGHSQPLSWLAKSVDLLSLTQFKENDQKVEFHLTCWQNLNCSCEY